MHDININDWQTIQTRNYVKRIKESVAASKPTDWAITLDIFLLFISFTLDRIFSDSPICIPRYIWIIILATGLLFTIGIILISQMKKAHIEYLRKILPPYDVIVTAFDEEVCYKLMSAVSFVDNLQSLKKSSKFSTDMDKSLGRFYYSEVIYYLNKAIDILKQYESSLSDVLVLEGNENGTKKIGVGRVENVCELIDSIYDVLYKFQKEDSLFATQILALNRNKQKYDIFRENVKTVKDILNSNDANVTQL